MRLFQIKDLEFKREEFLDDINEFEDILPIIEELQECLSYDKIECVGDNDCCNETKENYIIEIQGFINEEDEFITKEEVEKNPKLAEGRMLDLFIIRIYKCVNCGKWIIDILE